MNLTVLRVTLGSVLLGAAATALAPHVTSYVSSSAVVNARIVGVEAPFDGVIATASQSVATAVEPGDSLFTLKNAVAQGANVRMMKAELDAISGEIVGLEKQVRDLDDLRDRLIARREAKIAARRAWFAPRLEEARLEVAKADTALERAEKVHDRIAILAENGNAPARDLIDAETDLSLARSELRQKEAARRRLQVEAETLDGAIGVDLSSNDFERIEYRIDEISIRKADLDARLLGLQTRRAGLKTRISKASLESSRQQSFEPIATTRGVIWNASPDAGDQVSDGQRIVEVLDCTRRFIEVMLPERHFENVPAGTTAQVKLKGASKTFSAEVVASYGGGARPNREMQAARPRIESEAEGGVRVIVGIAEADMSSRRVRRSFCDVGRSAEVRFGMRENAIVTAASHISVWLGFRDTVDAGPATQAAPSQDGKQG